MSTCRASSAGATQSRRWPTSPGGLFPAEPEAFPARLSIGRTRTGAGSSLTNNAEIEALAVRRGYAVVHPEMLSLGQQVALFAGATHIVGEAGSALRDTVSGPAGTRVGVMLSQ